MIRNHDNKPGYEGIPDENIDEPLEFYTQTQNKMSLLKAGTRVSISIKRNNAAPVAEFDGREGIVEAIDLEDIRTAFPYFVRTDTLGGTWLKENEVTEIPEEPKDNVRGFIVGVCILVVMFYSAVGIWSSVPSNTTELITPVSDTVSMIPSNNLK